MLALGTGAPDFTLPDPSGRTYSLAHFAGARALLVIFLCNHCPYVKHVADQLARLERDYRARGLAVVGISANDAVQHPDDRPEMMAREAAARGYGFPYLHDESQTVAKAYRAACTPDFFLFDGERKLVYRGQFDASRPGNGLPVTGEHLRSAIDATLLGEELSGDQMPSLGCNIKWKPGSEPDYFG